MIRDFLQSDYNFYIEKAIEFYDTDAVLSPVPVSFFEEFFSQAMNNSPYVRGLILEHDGKPAGYAVLALSYSCEVGGIVVWIEEIYVCPEFQGKGLGKELLNFVDKEYENTAKRVRLEVCHSNGGAIRLYEKQGYKNLNYAQMIKDK